MTGINDDELRARFNALRRQDGRSEPEFHAMLDRARTSARTERPRFGSSMRWAAIAAGVLIAAILWAGKARDFGRKQQVTVEAMAITSWQSPTAGLLQPLARDILAPPPLLSSVFDGVTSPTLSLKTD